MYFGLRNAAQTFQRLINDMLRGLNFAFVYIDDVLIASRNHEEHEQHVRTILGRCQSYGIAINPIKCVFAVDSLIFLGHNINKDTSDRRQNASRKSTSGHYQQQKVWFMKCSNR
jgi:hypothetical protein